MSSVSRRFPRTAIVLAGVTVVVALGVLIWLDRGFTAPGPAVEPVRVRIEPGSSLRSVLKELAARGAIAHPRSTELYLRLHGRQPKVKAGDYELPAAASAQRILQLLEEGRVVLEHLTIVEGSTFADLRRALAAHPAVVSTLAGQSDAQVMQAIGRAGEHPEGRFFPDTYRFAARTADRELLKLAYAQMQAVLDEAWRARRADLPLKSPAEALTLASIVEKETGLATERARIAGVFMTRLRRGMRLQTDPTIIYGLGERYDGNIRSRDLVTDTPYNTYTRSGLPPTPIALPGREAVRAATQPEERGELFFVATGRGDGSHYFSRTLAEHNVAVRRYLAALRNSRRAVEPQAGTP
ncbi:MAG: endolytic transglycosylase MltG [Steroidobacteraceae bacterium]